MSVVDLLIEGERCGALRTALPIYFAEGRYSLSVQASKFHYCSPRETLPYSEYTHFEVMAKIPPGDVPSEWGSGGVFGWVPVEEINDLIAVLSEKYGICSL